MIEGQTEPLPRNSLRQIERFVVEAMRDVLHARAIGGGVARIFALHMLGVEGYEIEEPEAAHDDVGCADGPAHRHRRRHLICDDGGSASKARDTAADHVAEMLKRKDRIRLCLCQMAAEGP